MSALTSETGIGSGRIGCAALLGLPPNRQSSLSLADGAHGAGQVQPRALGISRLQARLPHRCSGASARAIGAGANGPGAGVPPSDFPTPPLATPPSRVGPLAFVAGSAPHATHLSGIFLHPSSLSAAASSRVGLIEQSNRPGGLFTRSSPTKAGRATPAGVTKGDM